MTYPAYYYNMLDELFDVYDQHLLFLITFDDIRNEVLELSRAFVQEHDAMYRALANQVPYGLDGMARIMDVADQIMYLVHKKNGNTIDEV